MSNVSLLHGEHNLNKEVTLIICIFSTRSKISLHVRTTDVQNRISKCWRETNSHCI